MTGYCTFPGLLQLMLTSILHHIQEVLSNSASATDGCSTYYHGMKKRIELPSEIPDANSFQQSTTKTSFSSDSSHQAKDLLTLKRRTLVQTDSTLFVHTYRLVFFEQLESINFASIISLKYFP